MLTYYSAGVQIGEFSDDAYYHVSIYTGSLFFGGIDGLLYLDQRGAGCSGILSGYFVT